MQHLVRTRIYQLSLFHTSRVLQARYFFFFNFLGFYQPITPRSDPYFRGTSFSLVWRCRCAVMRAPRGKAPVLCGDTSCCHQKTSPVKLLTGMQGKQDFPDVRISKTAKATSKLKDCAVLPHHFSKWCLFWERRGPHTSISNPWFPAGVSRKEVVISGGTGCLHQ